MESLLAYIKETLPTNKPVPCQPHQSNKGETIIYLKEGIIRYTVTWTVFK